MPYIVRIETGTINRVIYQTAVLDDPSLPGPDLLYPDRQVFGDHCGAG